MIANSREKEEMEGDDAHVNLTKGSGKEEWGGIFQRHHWQN